MRILIIIFLLINTNHFLFGKDTLEVKITPVFGFDGLKYGYNVISWNPLSENNPWKSTEVNLKGLPEKWKKFNTEQIWFDAKQFAFQNFHQGRISTELFNGLMKSWEIDTTDNLSRKPIKSFIHILIGIDDNDSIVYKIDTNNDYDFSDEQTNKAINIKNVNKLAIIKSLIWVKGEFLYNKEKIVRDIPILVVKDINNNVMYNFPEYFETKINDINISVSTGFSSLTFESNTYIKQKDKKDSYLIQKGEFINIKGVIYKNLGANYKNMTLKLEVLPKDTIIYSSQVGFNAVPFEGNEISIHKRINLTDLKGKYIFLDFWGSWCKPCIEEISHIKYAHDKIDKNKIEFIGIPSDSEDELRKAIKKYKIDWSQILSSKENDIIKLYNVRGFPETILINKNGEIIAKNLRGEKLFEQLNKYIQ